MTLERHDAGMTMPVAGSWIKGDSPLEFRHPPIERPLCPSHPVVTFLSRIPLDEETRRCLRDAGFDLDSVLEQGQRLAVRRTANLHTGGTLEDVTAQLHPELVEAAVRAARALDIPVVGLDLLVPAVDQPDYVFIEANERVGLANHQPQPTAERFIDLLFPLSQNNA